MFISADERPSWALRTACRASTPPDWQSLLRRDAPRAPKIRDRMDIESEGEPQLKLAWREMDGRPVAPPEERAGFGSHMLERALRGQRGEARITSGPQCIRCDAPTVIRPASQPLFAEPIVRAFSPPRSGEVQGGGNGADDIEFPVFADKADVDRARLDC